MDYNDLENQRREHWHPGGTEQEKPLPSRESDSLTARPDAINVLHAEVCHNIQCEAPTQNQAHFLEKTKSD